MPGGDGACPRLGLGAVAAWHQHLDTLGRRKKLLNEYHFKYLHYTNSLGTDLTIQLPEDHLWAAGNSVMKNGVEFVANMPTEEIFTAPLKTGINGVVYSALPLVNDGNIIDKFHFVIREGKIVEAHAEKGEEFLKAAISVAAYIGIGVVLQILGGIVISLLNDSWFHRLLLGWEPQLSAVAAMHLGMWVIILLMAVYSAVFYFLTVYFLQKHLNLE